MVEAYIDESGIDQRPVLVLAGFLSTAERWALFNEEWHEALEHLEPRKRGGSKRLKMAAAMSARMRGPESRALWDERLARFQSIIARHVMMGVGCAVELDAFAELFGQNSAYALDHAYHIAFSGIIGATVRHHQSLGLADKIDFVFDRQNAHFEVSNKAFLKIWKENPDLMKCVAGSPRWADDDEVLPLQAAEWLVWQIRKTLVSDATSPLKADELFITTDQEHPTTLQSLPINVYVWDRSRLTELRDDLVHERDVALAAMDSPAKLQEQLRQLIASKF